MSFESLMFVTVSKLWSNLKAKYYDTELKLLFFQSAATVFFYKT